MVLESPALLLDTAGSETDILHQATRRTVSSAILLDLGRGRRDTVLHRMKACGRFGV